MTRLIDADELIKTLSKYAGFTEKIDLNVFIKEIDNAPTVEVRPQGEWIPVSEEPPQDRDWYLGVFREPDTGFIGLPYICSYIGEVTKGTTNGGWILRGLTDIDNPSKYYKNLECVAWQPLPEPYRGEDM